MLTSGAATPSNYGPRACSFLPLLLVLPRPYFQPLNQFPLQSISDCRGSKGVLFHLVMDRWTIQCYNTRLEHWAGVKPAQLNPSFIIPACKPAFLCSLSIHTHPHRLATYCDAQSRVKKAALLCCWDETSAHCVLKRVLFQIGCVWVRKAIRLVVLAQLLFCVGLFIFHLSLCALADTGTAPQAAGNDFLAWQLT